MLDLSAVSRRDYAQFHHPIGRFKMISANFALPFRFSATGPKEKARDLLDWMQQLQQEGALQSAPLWPPMPTSNRKN